MRLISPELKDVRIFVMKRSLLIFTLVLGVTASTVSAESLRHSETLNHRFPTRDRPILSGTEHIVSSQSGYFVIHYTTQGQDSTSSSYADSAAVWADSSKQVLVFQLSWLEPPPDEGNGGDDNYDIYLLGLGSAVSGYTQLDFYVDGGYPDDAASYMALAVGMSAEELKASTAHHFNQACQYAYSANEFGAWMEQTAGWVESLVFSDLFLWASVTGNYLSNCHKYLYVADGWTEHGALLWPKYLAESTSDADIVRRIWSRCATYANNNTISATEYELQARGYFADAYQRFTSWNYITGSRDDGLHYENGDFINGEVDIVTSHTSYPASGSNPLVTAPYGLGCNYIEFINTGEGSRLHITVNGDSDQSPWRASVIVQDQGGAYAYNTFSISPSTDQGDTTLIAWSNLQRVVLVVQNLRLSGWGEPQGNYSYYAEALDSSPTSPANLTVKVSGTWLLLSWGKSTDPDEDLEGYNVYRGESAHMAISSMTLIGDAVQDQDPGESGVQWTDQDTFGANVVGDYSINYFYRVTAVDDASNESGPSNGAGEFDYFTPYVRTR